jgi:hypothetical protein
MVKISRILLSFSVSFLPVILINDTGYADLISDESKLGANAGAMSYCRDNHMTEDDNGRYNILAIKTLQDFDRLSSRDKVKTLIYKKAAEDGDYLGEPLEQKRCEDLRQLLYIQYGKPKIGN